MAKSFLYDVRKIVSDINSKGLSVPTIRDPKTNKGSVSFTMVFLSFGLMFACAVIAITMVINKWAGIFVESDTSLNILKEAFSMAFQMASLSTGLYWGRKWQDKKPAKEKEDPSPTPDDPDA